MMRKKRIIKATSLLMCMLILIFCTTCVQAQGSAYCVMDADTLEILEGCDEDLKLEMASTTKIMTAIIVLENIPLDETVVIEHDHCNVEGSSMYLKVGERYNVEDLLYGLMLVSGNDAALALADAVAGSCEGFVKMMNEKAEELCLKNTRYCNPHGLHSTHHYTTAYDLSLLCAYAMKNDDFLSIVSSKCATINELNDNKSRIIHNKNKFLNMMEGADGIKIGYTTKAGRCLCASVSKDGKRLICVILNHYNWFDMAVHLFNKYF